MLSSFPSEDIKLNEPIAPHRLHHGESQHLLLVLFPPHLYLCCISIKKKVKIDQRRVGSYWIIGTWIGLSSYYHGLCYGEASVSSLSAYSACGN